ncbi:Cullin-domain-containing protein [Cystobasidium minutum MCA 4210]|uniref:Cullin-domain-containing protein n=1 Tax=Cystobasidium minutum MCA 4210 TaxID=1397322 RepID=UPI0034CF33B4|eukprot:jgi/Rhomi1/192669/gm1.883_g
MSSTHMRASEETGEPPRKQLKMSAPPSPAPSSSSAASSSQHPFSALARSPNGTRISLESALKTKESGPSYGMEGMKASSSSGLSGGKAPKKLVLKTNRARPNGTPASNDFVNASIQTLVRAVRAILSTPPEPTPESLQALYSLCEGLVGTGNASDAKSKTVSQTLYDRIKIEIERKIGETSVSLRNLDIADGAAWLHALDTAWKAYTEKILLIRSIFLHLDRTYVLQTPELLSLWDMGLDIFRHRIVENDEIGAGITRETIALINKERDGGAVSQSLLSGVITMLTAVSSVSHTNIFVNPFLSSSSTYYQLEGQRLLGVAADGASDAEAPLGIETAPLSGGQMPIWDYLAHVKKRLSEEAVRCDTVIGQDVKGRILRVIEETLVGQHVAVIIQRGLPPMFEEGRIADLASMYALLARVSALPLLKKDFGEFLKGKGKEIVSDASRDDAMVDSLISFQSMVDQVLKGSFENDFDMVHVSREAFSQFINSRKNKPAEMIAKFIDQKMKLGNKATSDEELDKVFDQVLRLFRYCQGKDIFEAFYKKDFAKRLLLNRSASSDAEKSMLLKLKEECGPGFTANLETMAKDIDLSNDVMKAYKEFLDPDVHSILSVNILTTGNWPTYHVQPCRVPEDLQKELQRFSLFYKAKYAGRSLSWMHSLDQCTLKVEFNKGPGGGRKELNVSFHQTVVLLLFNDKGADEKISYKDILELTGLEPKEASRTLQSLACARHKILTKHPKGREVNETDKFSFNASFKDDKYRLKINQIQQKETPEEAKETTKKVLLDRSSHLQLVIVRILKSRKTIKHQELVMEVVNTLKERFQVEPSEIKKAVDTLIDQEYMERSGRDVYNYLVSLMHA